MFDQFTQKQQENLQHIVSFVKEALKNSEKGHDWWHIERVTKNTIRIASQENANSYIACIAALLHDINDDKFNGNTQQSTLEIISPVLNKIACSSSEIQHIAYIIDHQSFKNSFSDQAIRGPFNLELAVVQDADRLDAIGAIGIARTFHYGGYKNREIYNPNIAPINYTSKEEYLKTQAPTINHFHEKLLLLKDLMQTETGKHLAASRHQFMLAFLDQFHAEWDGTK